MLELLTSGGIGDAVFSYAKLYSSKAPFDIREQPYWLTHLTNIRGAGVSDRSISRFYTSQGVPHSVVCTPGAAWREQHRSEFDHYLGTAWDATNGGDESSWDIEPYPPLIYTHIPDVDILLSPFSAYNKGRKINLKELIYFGEKVYKQGRTITLAGWADQAFIDALGNLPFKNMLNTDMITMINLVCSASTIISNIGFTSILGCAAGKQVFSVGIHPVNNKDYYHPQWNVQCPELLRGVNL